MQLDLDRCTTLPSDETVRATLGSVVIGIRDCYSLSVEGSGSSSSSSKTKLIAIRNAQASPFQILRSDTPSRQLGIQKLFVPEDMTREAATVPDLDIYGFKAIADVVDF